MVLISKNYFEWDTELPYFNLQPETKINKNKHDFEVEYLQITNFSEK